MRRLSVNEVAKSPGSIMLTWMPNGFISMRSASVYASIACLLAQ